MTLTHELLAYAMRFRKQANSVRDHQLATVLPSVWKKLNQGNDIDSKYNGRVRKTEIGHRSYYPAILLQSKLYKDKIEKISLEGHPPVFILGLWRSGTTHLHYMLSRDSRFGYLKNRQAFTFNMALLSMDKYLQDRQLIPEGNLVEVNFKQLEEEPLNTLEDIYESLNLPGFRNSAESVEENIDSVSNYRKNNYNTIPSKYMDQINNEWAERFEELGYKKKAESLLEDYLTCRFFIVFSERF